MVPPHIETGTRVVVNPGDKTYVERAEGLMALRSPLINVMVAAVQKASRHLARDFGEVENLQVSRKGPADFVSTADRRAESILRAELQKARPRYGFVQEEGGVIEGEDNSNRLDRRSAGRNDQLPARHSAFRRFRGVGARPRTLCGS